MSVPGVRVRLVPSPAPADLAAAALVWDRAEAGRRGEQRLPAHPEPAAEHLVAERIRHPGSRLLLAETADRPTGQVIGMVTTAPGRADDGAGAPVDGLTHLSMLAVDPAWWGRGVARLLLAEATARAWSTDQACVQLWTQSQNLRAQLVYERFGFQRTGRTRPDAAGHAIHYRLPRPRRSQEE